MLNSSIKLVYVEHLVHYFLTFESHSVGEMAMGKKLAPTHFTRPPQRQEFNKRDKENSYGELGSQPYPT